MLLDDFFPDICVFKDIFSGKVREIGKEEDGLYLLLNQPPGKTVAITLAADARSEGNKVDISLWHRRLGHVSSVVLKRIFFSCSFYHISTTTSKCTVCPCAK